MAMDQNWVQKMLSFYSQGYSDVEVCRELGISKKQFQGYVANSQAFADLVDYGHDLSEAWAYSKNREYISSRDATSNNIKALQHRMENMHGWSQKTESKSANINLQGDVLKLRQELESILPEMAKALGRDDLVKQITHDSEAQTIEVTNDEE